ncbi:MAG: hypothetical protein NZ739_06040 [Verrucomicrobiae bacterium]|nr:hypothetical protein [Verrucomicrobiae bacterium]MDW7980108.1 hypothetical protein [Verrucomicrobiales bacterium]
MKRIAQALSAIALIGTIGPPVLFFADRLDLGTAQQWMLAATVLWFVTAPIWMEHKTT